MNWHIILTALLAAAGSIVPQLPPAIGSVVGGAVALIGSLFVRGSQVSTAIGDLAKKIPGKAQADEPPTGA